MACYRKALVLKPDYAEAHNNLGTALTDQGKLDEAIACYRQALVLKPDYAEAYSNLAFCLNYSDKVTAAELFAAHQDWNERFGPGPLRTYATRGVSCAARFRRG